MTSPGPTPHPASMSREDKRRTAAHLRRSWRSATSEDRQCRDSSSPVCQATRQGGSRNRDRKNCVEPVEALLPQRRQTESPPARLVGANVSSPAELCLSSLWQQPQCMNCLRAHGRRSTGQRKSCAAVVILPL